MSSAQTTNRLIELASKPSGVHCSEVTWLMSADASARLCALVTRGVLHRGGTARGHIRYFKSEVDAKKYAKSQASKPANVTIHPLTKAAWAKNAQVVMNSKTKVTICPGYTPRFEAVTVPFIHTANQSGRVPA